MSQPLAPRPSDTHGSGPPTTPLLQKPRKISTACTACKTRKTKCSGGEPCSACSARSSECSYDATADQRRKIANRRNVEDLNDALAKIETQRKLIGGIIATIKAGNVQQINDLIDTIKSGVELSQLAAHLRNGLRSSPDLAQAYDSIVFEIDGPPELPSPRQLLANLNNRSDSMDSGMRRHEVAGDP